MRAKTKLTHLEQRVGASDCQRCGAPLLPPSWDETHAEPLTPEEFCATLHNIFARYFNRERALDLLAECRPERPIAVAAGFAATVDQTAVLGPTGGPHP
jgi:hypothetical protein